MESDESEGFARSVALRPVLTDSLPIQPYVFVTPSVALGEVATIALWLLLSPLDRQCPFHRFRRDDVLFQEYISQKLVGELGFL